MVIQLSSARLCNQLNLMQVSIYSFMHQIDTSIRVLSWKNFVCNFQLEENLPLIELDPQLLKQAVINIIKMHLKPCMRVALPMSTSFMKNPL